jgi:D-aspartate ligase
LSAVRSLGRLGVCVRGLDWNPHAPGLRSRYCAGSVCPDPLRQPEELVALLVAEGRRLRRPAVLIPSIDPYVLLLSRFRDRLAPYFLMALSPPGVVEALVSKRGLYELAERVGTPYPRTWYPRSADEAGRISGEVQFPAFVKPHHGHLWRRDFGIDHKGFKVQDAAELGACLALADAAGHPVVVQEFLEGPDPNIQEATMYIDRDGAPLAAMSRRYLRQNPPNQGVPSLADSVHAPELEQLLERFCRAVDYRGIAGAECKRDPSDGRFKLLDFNARLPLSNQLVLDAGVNLALLQYLDLTGQQPRAAHPARIGVRWVNLADDLPAFAELRRRGELGWGDWLRSLRGVRSFATFAADDPRPALAATRSGLHMARLAFPAWRKGE